MEDRNMPTQRMLSGAIALFAFAFFAYLIGCSSTGQTKWFAKEAPKPAETVAHEEDAREQSAAVRDTVTTAAWMEGMRRMAVGGYGLVVGLGKNGTSMCPRPVRDYMLQDLRARYRLGADNDALKHLAPENLIDSEETAVVVVYGEIPAAAQKGDRFDLTVRALDRTDVRSLEGGWLMPCSLKLWANDQPVEGRVLGEGSGQVFINPFGLKEDAATKVDPREGRILGGGQAAKARRLRLVLTNPSAAIASRLMFLINRQFGVEPTKTADAVSPHAVNIMVPPRWHGREVHFLELLMHLYVPAVPSFHDMRLRELCEEAVRPDAALADISLAWEGMGKTVLSSIRKLYTHENLAVSYFSARAGLRVGDSLALDVMARQANNLKSPFREVAIEELGAATDLSRAVMILRPLLDSNDERIRELAYEGLRQQDDPIVRSVPIGGKRGFILDIVPTKGRYVIGAKRTLEQRITLFGSNILCQTPAFYSHRDEMILITADAGASKLRLVRKTPLTGRFSPPITCGLGVRELISVLGNAPTKDADGHFEGLGLTYSQVVEVLHDLCANKTIDALFVLQGIPAGEIAAPSELGRPESEL
jgi:flagellar basal body P-ring protein FlgI